MVCCAGSSKASEVDVRSAWHCAAKCGVPVVVHSKGQPSAEGLSVDKELGSEVLLCGAMGNAHSACVRNAVPGIHAKPVRSYQSSRP